MTVKLGETFLGVAIVAIFYAIYMWKKRKDHKPKITPVLATLGGLALGAGIVGATHLNIDNYSLGYFPLWLLAVLLAGGLFGLEMWGYDDHQTRTPVLGFASAFILALAITGWTATEASKIGQNIQPPPSLTSVTHPAKHHHGKG